MLLKLWGFISRLGEKLIYNEEAKIEACCHETVMRCCFMVCDVPTSPHRGLYLHSLLVSSSIWPAALSSRLTYSRSVSSLYSQSKTPPSLHRPLILLSLRLLAEFRTPMLLSRVTEGSTLPYFQETVQPHMPEHALSRASHCRLGHILVHQSGDYSTLSELVYDGGT